MFQYNPLLCSFSLQFIFFAEQLFYGNIRHWILIQTLLFLTISGPDLRLPEARLSSHTAAPDLEFFIKSTYISVGRPPFPEID